MISLTKVTLGWTPNKGSQSQTTPRMHLPNQRPRKPDRPSQVHIVRQAIPGFNEKTPWIKKHCRAPLRHDVGDVDAGNLRTQRDKRQENAARYTHIAGG